MTPLKVYTRLMESGGTADWFDRHVLACTLAAARAENGRPLTEALGLDRPALARLLDAMFPAADILDDLVDGPATPGDDAIEEPDFRALLLAGRRGGSEIEEWLARIVARRSLAAGHLWHSLGLTNRKELSDMLHRHFPAVAARNTRGMRWKKFFYREMCQAEGVNICKSPVCDICPEFDDCFKPED